MVSAVMQGLIGLALIVFVRWVARRREDDRRGAHPPGPPGLPLLGNLLDMPDNPSWTTYIRWGEKYDSDILRLEVLGSNIIIVNSLEAANDLLDKRSAIYSDRPDMPMLNDLCGFGWNVAFRHYDDSWRNGRRVFQHELGPQVVKRFRGLEEHATHQFLRNLLREPAEFMGHLRHMSAFEILRIAYGIEVTGREDPYVDTAEHAVGAVVATCNPGSYLVNIMPFLKHIPEWFPGAKFQRDAKVWRKYITELRDKPFAIAKERTLRGESPDCAAKSLLESLQTGEDAGSYTEDDIKFALGSMYAGGSDTTVSALGSFLLGVVLNPAIQKRAQEALDRVCPGRLPTFADQEDLPYIDAIVKESLRWNPVLPIDVAHCSTADDVYRGYFIPKGSLVLANSWAMLHDPAMYPSPTSFDPDRFMLAGADALDARVREPDAAFGFGRRICPGRHLAYDAIWIAVACVLSVFDVRKARDAQGREVTPSGEYNVGFACYPLPFPCEIRPRSQAHEALIRATEEDS
ncbi:cytochrome P450 [Phanerochaete sordida]|uniref:Cytochrome P450 n=1 Tax=Phanerochaete sordida TaxID=48140 RepID=A0A9P3GIW3_9APHY|nr:cytochrome P450 [Phanerochaete sordida]